MKYLGTITDPKDLTTKKYVDDSVSGVQTSLTTHIGDDTNPHKVTKTQVGLDNVDNIKQWSANNHPTTLSGYGITDAATSSQLSALTTRVSTNEDNIAMAESDIEGLQGDVGTLKTDMTTVKGAVTTLQDTYVPNTRKINGKALSADIALTASDVGAGNTNFYRVDNVAVEVSKWVANTNSQAADQEKTDYPFMATISITTPAVTTNDIARVMFGYTEQASGNFAPNCYTTTNGVIIEAKEKPSATITLDYILIERIL